MKKWLIVVISLFLFSLPATADSPIEQKTINAVNILLESTVIIDVFGGEGSGFYISPNEIITNAHVVNDTKTISFEMFSGKNCFAQVIYKQSETDLALLKTDCKGVPLKIATNIVVGQDVITSGNPLRQRFFVSKGIVGLIKDGEILHDAAIDHGSSGGAVVNLDGEVIGVSQAMAKDMPRMSMAIDVKTLSYFLYQAKE